METEWWRGAVIYQIYPRSFQDSNGDGVGDLPGIAERLDHVAALGADAVWISPFFKSPMKDFGYDVEDYRAVDPIFGTMEDFDRLLGRAHGLGLRVIIDMVLSHTSDRHAWFRESRSSRDNPRADWYVWADPKPDGSPPNNWLSIFGGPAWTWDSRRRQYYLHNFLSSQPDLNLHREDVQDAVLAECEFWLAKGVDGFRLDACNFYMHDRELRDNPPCPPEEITTESVSAANPYAMQRHAHDKSQPENLDFLRRLRALMDRYPGRMTVAEVGDEESIAVGAAYVAGTGLLHTAYGFTLLSDAFGPQVVRRAIETFESQPGGGWPSWAFSNHDVVRPVTRWREHGSGAAFAKQLLALLLSLRGTAFVYQGEELGLPEADVPYDRLQDPYGIAFWPDVRSRDGSRTPMPWQSDSPHAGFSEVEPWLPVDGNHVGLSVARQENDPRSMLAFARAFIGWRRERQELRTGTIRFIDAEEPILAFVRGGTFDDLLCVFNLGRRPTAWRPPLASAPQRCPALEGHGLAGQVGADGVSIDLPVNGIYYGKVRGGDGTWRM